MLDLAQHLETLGVHALAERQTWYVRTQTWCEHVAASICADGEVLTFTQSSRGVQIPKQEQEQKQTVVSDREHRDGCTN